MQANTAASLQVAEKLGAVPMSPVLSVATNSVIGPNRVNEAVQLLKANPMWHQRTLRALAEQTGISKDTWAKAKKRV